MKVCMVFVQFADLQKCGKLCSVDAFVYRESFARQRECLGALNLRRTCRSYEG